jgi:hypothetical protein
MYQTTKIRNGSQRRSSAAARRWEEAGRMVEGDAEARRMVVEGDFFRASSDISGRRYGSDGWCSVWALCPVDGDACLLRKQKRKFCFIFSFRR